MFPISSLEVSKSIKVEPDNSKTINRRKVFQRSEENNKSRNEDSKSRLAASFDLQTWPRISLLELFWSIRERLKLNSGVDRSEEKLNY